MAMRYPMPSVLSPVIDLKTGKLTTAWVNYLKGLEEVAGRFSGAAEGQIAFPATQNPSTDVNTLDDYEEGTFTPTFSFVTPGDLAVVYSVQSGAYTKIGNRCLFEIQVIGSITHSTASGSARVGGLPFDAAGSVSIMATMFGGYTKANHTWVQAQSVVSTSQLNFLSGGSGQAAAFMTTADVPSGATVNIIIGGNYRV